MPTYIARAGAEGPVKIGRADDPEQRVRDIQTGHHEQLEIIRIVDTPFDAEPLFHERFALQHIRGEWFSFVEEMMTFVPSAPEEEPPIGDIVRAAKRRSILETEELCLAIWQSFRGFETRARFTKRLARLLQIKESRTRHLMYGDVNRVDVHELEGLRAIARKLHREVVDAATTPSPQRRLPLGDD